MSATVGGIPLSMLRRTGGGSSSAAAFDIDFRTGQQFDKLTVSSPTAYSGSTGPRVLDHTGTYVPKPAGMTIGWRGLRVLSGIAGSPAAGWQAEGNGSPYWSLGSGNGFSWFDAAGAPLAGVEWWGPVGATSTNLIIDSSVRNATFWAPSTFTVADALPYAGLPTPKKYTYNGGATLISQSIGTTTVANLSMDVIVECGGGVSANKCAVLVRDTTAATFPLGRQFNHVGTVSGGAAGVEEMSELLGTGPNGGALFRWRSRISTHVSGNGQALYIYPAGTTGQVLDAWVVVHYAGLFRDGQSGVHRLIETTTASVASTGEFASVAAVTDAPGGWTGVVTFDPRGGIVAATYSSVIGGAANGSNLPLQIINVGQTRTYDTDFTFTATTTGANFTTSGGVDVGIRLLGATLPAKYRRGAVLIDTGAASGGDGIFSGVARTTVGIGGPAAAGGTAMHRPVLRARGWNRALSDAEFLAA